MIGHFDADYILVRRAHVGPRKPAREAYMKALDTGRYREVASKHIFTLWKRSEE